MDGISSPLRLLDPATQSPKERRARCGASLTCLCALRDLRRDEGGVFTFQSIRISPLPQPGGWKCCGFRLGTLRTWVTPDYLGSPESAGEAPRPSLVPALAPSVIHRGADCGGRGRGGSFRASVAPSCVDPAPGSKAPTRVSWVLPVADFHGIRAGLTLLPSWSLGQQRLSCPGDSPRGTCLEKGPSPAQ